MRRHLSTLGLGLLLSLVVAAPAAAEPGDLDPGFSGDGRVAALAGGGFVARAVAVQPDGKVVVAGYACAPDRRDDGTCRSSGDSSFEMTRYTADGELDAGFGAGGVVTTSVGIARSQAFDLSLAPDGRIVLAGVARDGGGRDGFTLARYGPDGALDRSFGEQGVSIVPVGSGFAGIADLVETGGGGLVAVGVANAGGGGPRFALARFRSDGSLDGGFGQGGTVVGGPAPYGSALAGVRSPAGDVLAAGIAGASSAPADARFGFLRTRADGSIETAFGDRGSLLVGAGPGASFANALVGLQDGRAVAAGAAFEPGGRQVMAFTRITADGRLDATWDGDGTAMVRIGDGALAADAARDAQGRLVGFGQTATGGADWRFAVTRLGTDGLLDRAFGTGGVTISSFEGAASARATAGAVAPDGSIVAAGIACLGGSGAQCDGGSPRLALARYQGEGSASPPGPGPPTNSISGVQVAPGAALAFPLGKLDRPFTVRVRVECLQRTTCAGPVAVRTRRAYRPVGRRGRARAITVAAGRVRVRPGRSRDITLRIRRTGRALVRSLGRVDVEVALTVRDPSGRRRTIARDAVLAGR